MLPIFRVAHCQDAKFSVILSLMHIIDARDLPDCHHIDSDLTIIGAGAAGLTLALTLSRLNLRISVIELGGMSSDIETDQLREVVSLGRPCGILARSTTSCVGGTTHLWGGHCVPIRPYCFDKRDWIPGSEWPFPAEELAPYYQQAHDLLGLGAFDYEIDSVLSGAPFELFGSLGTDVETTVSKYQPGSLAQICVPKLKSSENVSLYLHAYACKLVATDNGQRVQRIELRSSTGKNWSLSSSRVVIAAGGIENARLLLASGLSLPGGFGNRRDLVGRYFMEHIWYQSGVLEFADSSKRFPVYENIHAHPEGYGVRTHLSLSPVACEDMRIPGFRAELSNPDSETLSEQKVTGARLLEELMLPGKLSAYTKGVRNQPGAHLREEEREDLLNRLFLSNYTEQVPNPDSRVTLSGDKNALGQPLAQLDWRLSRLDVDGIEKAHHKIKNAFEKSGLAEFKYLEGEFDRDLVGADGGGHHIGTTRMALSANQGVVDENCRVHDMSNVYVSGSSVFPSAGYANPTLTIIALAIRLGAHLESTL
jgi:choline dehydrogenase-like flavoprotein